MKIPKIILLIIYLTTFTSCSDNFFDFDEVEHYRKDITHEDLSKLYDETEKTGKPVALLDILENDNPKNLEENFGAILQKKGFNKTELNKSEFEEINSLFSEHTCLYNSMSACIPTYRDIIIFKKNHKTVGIAKICFDCELSYIIGTKKEVENFGQCGDYEKLKKLLE